MKTTQTNIAVIDRRGELTPIARAAVIRIVVGLIAAGVGALAGLIGHAIWRHVDIPSADVCASVAAGVGFVAGVCFGNRNLEGRAAIIILGLLAGIVAGSVCGHLWGRIERDIVAYRIESLGRRPNNKGTGVSTIGYDDIGLRYGICWGAVAGIAAGCEWNRKTRLASASAVIPLCIVIAGIWEMNAEFRAHSAAQIEMSHPRDE